MFFVLHAEHIFVLDIFIVFRVSRFVMPPFLFLCNCFHMICCTFAVIFFQVFTNLFTQYTNRAQFSYIIDYNFVIFVNNTLPKYYLIFITKIFL